MNEHNLLSSRRKFIKHSGAMLGVLALFDAAAFTTLPAKRGTKVNAHLWVYASKYPPTWDSTPNIEAVFSDLSYAGISGVELMEVNLRHRDAVENLSRLAKKYNLPVSGSSYGAGSNMWDEAQHKTIIDDVKVVVPRLQKLKGKNFGISVGDAKRTKTEKELDAQAAVLKEIVAICNDNGIEANLHNHTYEVVNGMHDLKGTLARVPQLKLGPDLNWLIRGGVNPVDFINEYGNRITYMHIRDQYADGTWTEYVGQGATNFAVIAQALKAVRFSGDVAIELAFPNNFTPVNPLKEDWKKSRQYVKKVFGW
ncbi:MAG TPA: sugar phosphate isomerase/epimerase [Flavisolibacter sp.]|nr:sugar phosphate isomerase/epimerase [Flavisolibacter sp.]